MLPIVAPIDPGSTGERVSNLQAALILLFDRGVFVAYDPPNRPTVHDLNALTEKLRAEQSAQVFGDATGQLLSYFQVQQGLGDHFYGVVEETTAKRLNELLGKHGVVFEPDGFVVRGRITDTQGQPSTTLKVVAFDRDLRIPQLLGITETDLNGEYYIEYRAEDFQHADAPSGSAPWLIVEVLETSDGKVLAKQEVQKAARDQTVSFTLANVDAVSEWQRIGEAVGPLLKGQGTPGVEIKASHAGANARSVDLAPWELTPADVDFIAQDAELDRAAVEAWWASSRMLREAIQRLGDDHPDKRSAVDAHGWPFLYSHARIRPASTLDEILNLGPRQWAKVRRNAEDANRIPRLDEASWNQLSAALALLVDLRHLDPARAAADAFANLLAAVGAALPRQVALDALAVYRTDGLDASAFERLADRHTDDAMGIRGFARAVRLHELVEGDLSLVKELDARIGEDTASTEPLARLSTDDWMVVVKRASAPEADAAKSAVKAYRLQAVVESEHPLPALAGRLKQGALVFRNPETKGLAEHVNKYPDVIEALLSGKTADSDVDSLPKAIQKTVRSLGRFSRTGLTYEVATDLINLDIETPAAAHSLGKDVIGEMLEGKYDRLKRELIERFMDKTELIAAGASGFVSNLVGVRLRLPWFGGSRTPIPEIVRENMPTLRGFFGDLDECICRPCESVLGQPAYLVDLLNLLKKIPAGKSPEGALSLLRERRPDIYDLELTCENAETEMPYIDLVLEVLENAAGLFRNAARVADVADPESLFEPHVDPSIRSALEPTTSTIGQVLTAQRAAIPAALNRWFVEDGSRRWTVKISPFPRNVQITAISYLRSTTGKDLGAAPENRNLLAYQKLVGHPFPWALPFDLAHAEAGLFLDRLGVSRKDLIRLHVTPNDQHLAAETLGITLAQQPDVTSPEAEWALISRARSGVDLWAVWGLSPEPDGTVSVRDPASGNAVTGLPKDVLSRVSVLMDRAAVDLDTLEMVLATRFAGPLTISKRDQCKTSEMRVEGLTEAHLDRIHRFIRLSKKLPKWSVPLLDSAILGSGAADLGGDLKRIATVERLSRRLSLPLSHLLALGVPLLQVKIAGEAAGEQARTLFEQVFRGSLATPAQRAIFELNQQSSELKVWADSPQGQPRLLMDSALVAIAAAVGIGVGPLRSLLDRGVVPNELNLVALTAVFRRHALSRALGTTTQQLHQIQTLCDIDPFAGATDYGRLEEFCDTVELIRSSGLTLEDTAYALLPFDMLESLGMQRPSTRASDEAVHDRLKSLQAALRTVEAESASAPREADVARVLSEWMDLAIARQVVAAIETRVMGPATTATDPRIVAALWQASAGAGAAPGARLLGEAVPLFSERDALRLFVVPADAPRTDAEQILRRKEVERRLSAIVDRVAERWPGRRREQRLVETVASWTGWPLPLAASALQRDLGVDAGNLPKAASEVLLDPNFWDGDSAPLVESRTDLYEWLHRLDRLATLTQALKIPVEMWRLLAQASAGPIDGIDLRDMLAPASFDRNLKWMPRWPAWKALISLAGLINEDQSSFSVLRALFANLAGGQPPVDAQSLTPLAALLSIPADEALALARRTIAPSPAIRGLRDPVALKRLLSLAKSLRSLRASAAQYDALIDCSKNTVAAFVARQLLEAKAGAAAWPAALSAVNDTLRKLQRDALVAHLVHRDGLRDTNDLYERYLIDSQMQPCMRTTRALQAIAAVQLLVQRILFGLEEGVRVPEGSGLRDQWVWMRNYRVWEANRKVFLYPENWLFPELRDDKSSSFKLLESALGQGELTQDLARQSFSQFLDDVAQTGQTQVLGMFEDVSDNDAHRNLYVLGRSLNPPYGYFWRRCNDFGSGLMEWTPWQRIELDIQGDHVLPFVLSGQLHIAWPTFERKEGQRGQGPAWEIRFAWSRFDGTGWKKQETSREVWPSVALPFSDERSWFSFRCEVDKIASTVTFTGYVGAQPPNSVTAPPAPTEYEPNVQTNPNGHGWYNYYTNQTLAYETAGRRVDCGCWIKLLNASNQTGYIELTPESAPDVRLRKVGAQSIGLRDNFEDWGSGSILPSSFAIEGSIRGVSLPVTPAQTVPEVPIRHFQSFRLHFTVDATTLSAAQVEALGLEVDVPRNFEAKQQFRIDRLGHGNFLEATPGNIPVPDLMHPWMNGFREVTLEGISDWPFSIEDSTSNIDRRIFELSSNDLYWALGGASHRPHAQTPSTWYFIESGTGVYIDLSVPGSQLPRAFRLYPDGYPESAEYRAAWGSEGNLNRPDLQHGRFGPREWLTPNRALVSDPWIGAREGKLAFDARMPYACYNWEVFFHAPLLIADQLSKQHKFEDAERWLRYVFDPTSGDPGGDASRFLKFRVFRELDTNDTVMRELTALAQVAAGNGMPEDDDAIENLIDRWRSAPFRPFLIARRRHAAFLWRTLFAYLDNLIAWADTLYRRDTRESINEATLLYVLAARILGPRPRLTEATSKKKRKTYADLASGWDDFANFWFDTTVPPVRNPRFMEQSDRWPADEAQASPQGFLMFCIPFNDKLFSYWNAVDERLFNIRHCRNIEGITRDLPLTDAPIDPEFLVRATAAGLDLSDVINGLYAPPPHYRYGVLSARAAELTNEAKALGAAMLSAIEKRDAEHLAQLRSSNEISLLKLVRDVRALQISEAERNIEALRSSRKSVGARYSQYMRLLGRNDIKVPEEQQSAGEEAMLGSIESGLTSNRSNLGLIKEENEQYVGFEGANTWSIAAGVSKTIAGVQHAAAAIAVAAAWMDPKDTSYKILQAGAQGASALGDGFSVASQAWKGYAEQQGMMAGHLRRRDDWAFQSNQSLKELQQIDKQILANEIRIQITRKELDNHVEQIEQAQAVDEVMRSKFSNEQLYQWMVSQLSGLYFNAYRMALEMARRAERAAVRELGVKPLNILRKDYWDSLRAGLLAGERLHQDLKRLEVSYLDQNRREYELTKHVSLRRLDPQALVNLRIKDGEGHCMCEFEIPEWLFDLDTPGHYLRRIKSVNVSIPCVTGPYASVNCKLTLLKSEVRHERTATAQDYLRSASRDDPRFTDYFGASEAIVTSTGNADSGMFETQLRDERFLPFEGSGVISRWRLELPGKYPQFDYSTISDVVLSIRYTAREGGESLRDFATEAIRERLLPQTAEPLRFPVAFSCRYDFPTEWVRARTGSGLKISITRNLLPYWMDAANLMVRGVSVINLPTPDAVEWPIDRLGTGGFGEADLGAVGASVTDRIVVLSIG